VLKKFFLLLCLFFCVSLGALFYLSEKDWVDLSTLDYLTKAKPSIIIDEEGREIARFELDRRDPISYDKIPPILIKAFIAAEDHDFFNHPGISFRGILRSLLVNIYHARKVQGASTITQQLARSMFLSCQRTFLRKIQEVFVAIQLERQLSKEQILELYLNALYFGKGIYGVEAACRRFWNKSLKEISIDQAATLAAVTRSARYYSPLNSPNSSKKRRDIILSSMCNLCFITKKECEDAKQKKLTILDHTPGRPIRLYIQEWIRNWAERIWGREALYTKGLKIKTTLNLDIQESAEKAFVKTLSPLRKKIGEQINGGLISIEPTSGQIKALVCGFDFHLSQYNRVFQARRQMGSSFKPILYSYALSKGIELNTVLADEPISIVMPNGQEYKPKNWNDDFEGPMTLVRALTFSNNIITIKLFLKLMSPEIINFVKNFGIISQLPLLPSAALGTLEVTPEENCAAFNVFANNGFYVKPYFIEYVKDTNDIKIWQNNNFTPIKVLDSIINSKMVKALSWRMSLNAKLLANNNWINSESIGKTGSTNGAVTMWFVGATPELTTAIYVGRDDGNPMGSHGFASKTAFPIWLNLYRSIHFYKKRFYIDPTLREIPIDWITGERSSIKPEEDEQMRVITLLQ